ncbi:MAG: DNA translocase FtsK 4TM domain-containing protein [Filomicrobium sp.]
MYSEFQPEEGYRLLPRAVEDGVRRFVGRGLGYGLGAALLIAWLSLISWSVDDPSLTHVTREPAGNFFGYFGAVISDLLLQMLGLASVVLLFAPMFWGIDLVRGRALQDARWKILAFVASVVLLAGALGFVPRIIDWPLNHGYGGIVGDGVVAVAMWAAKDLAGFYTSLLCGLALAVLGVVFVCASIGIDEERLQQLLRDLFTGGKERLRNRYATSVRRARPPSGSAHHQRRRGFSYHAAPSAERHWRPEADDRDIAADDDFAARGSGGLALDDDYDARRDGIRLPMGDRVAKGEPARHVADHSSTDADTQATPPPPPPEKAAAHKQDAEFDDDEAIGEHGSDLIEPCEDSMSIARRFAPESAAAVRLQASQAGKVPSEPLAVAAKRHAEEPRVQESPTLGARPRDATTRSGRNVSKEEASVAPEPKAAADSEPQQLTGQDEQPELPGLFDAPNKSKPKTAKPPRKAAEPQPGGLFSRPFERAPDVERDVAKFAGSDRVASEPKAREPVERVSREAVSRESSSQRQSFSNDARVETHEMVASPDPAAAADPAQLPRTKLRMTGGYARPSLNLLHRTVSSRPGPELTQAVLRGTSRLLEDFLQQFGVNGKMTDVQPGPVVTVYRFAPDKGTNVARVIGLADDIARSVNAPSARIFVIPGSGEVAIELPNVHRAQIGLREVLCSEAYRSSGGELPIALGVTPAGQPVVADLGALSNTLIAGAPATGKSAAMKAMVLSLVYRSAPVNCRLLVIDGGFVDFAPLNGVGHLLAPVISEAGEAVRALEWVVGEIDERAKNMAKLSARSLSVFNNRVRNARRRGEMIARTVHTGFCERTGQPIYEHEEMVFEPLPHITIFIDDLADLMGLEGPRIEAAIQTISERGKAVGVHLVAGTRTTAELCVTPVLQESFKGRISFKLNSKACSRKILGDQGAEQLLDFGDMLLVTGPNAGLRVHAADVSQEEFEAVALALREAGRPRYLPSLKAALKDPH